MSSVGNKVRKLVTQASAIEPHAELFAHGADIGVRGIGPTRNSAFEQAALALSMAVTDPAGIMPRQAVEVACEAPDDAFLLLDWLNALIYEMSARRLVFGRFAVSIEGHRLCGRAWGEPVDRVRHQPAVEPKGATLTALKVERRGDGAWVAQCIVDV
jgi:SHS2 domain-containing protein